MLTPLTFLISLPRDPDSDETNIPHEALQCLEIKMCRICKFSLFPSLSDPSSSNKEHVMFTTERFDNFKYLSESSQVFPDAAASVSSHCRRITAVIISTSQPRQDRRGYYQWWRRRRLFTSQFTSKRCTLFRSSQQYYPLLIVARSKGHRRSVRKHHLQQSALFLFVPYPSPFVQDILRITWFPVK